MGGEKIAVQKNGTRKRGSPPRGRGKVTHYNEWLYNAGITPAWAGKSTWSPSFKDLRQDHPRVGGEKYFLRFLAGDKHGSPPRGRGKGQRFIYEQLKARITPAWAGKRPSCRQRSCRSRDHPRVGGEKSHTAPIVRTGVGSPPRGRGKAAYDLAHLVAQRITPAWAGKRLEIKGDVNDGGDHPRVGGEKVLISSRTRGTPGSPPRGRGKALEPFEHRPRQGITPAWAGKSSQTRSYCQLARDHPRVGGEKVAVCFTQNRVKGSPPRGRGKAYQTYG